MRFFLRAIVFLLFVGLLFPQLAVEGDEVDYPSVSAEAAVVYAPATGEFVFEKSADKKLPLASTTKIMTALLALEYCEENGDKIITVTEEAASTEGSSMGLEARDRINLSDLCAGIMLASGNDGANAIASALSDDFPALMNSRAEEIGMINTNFVTPSGLDADEHYSTARDMALLTAEAMKNEEFAPIVSMQSLDITYNNGSKRACFSNHNKLLRYLDGCIGVKTGYTQKSGRCLVSAVEREGVMLICVTLNAPDDWSDHEKLYEYAFSRMSEYYPVNSEFVLATTVHPVICRLDTGEKITHFSQQNIKEIIYLPRFIYSSSYNKGDVVGKVDYISQGNKIYSKNILIS